MPDAASPAPTALHPLLMRQLRRLKIDPAGSPPTAAECRTLLEAVAKAYSEADQDRYLLERSQALVCDEMAALNAELKRERDALDQRVRERTVDLHLSQARLSSLLSLSADWVWEQDEALRFSFVSKGFLAAMNTDSDFLIGSPRRIDPALQDDPEAVWAFERLVSERKSFRGFVYCLELVDGSRCWIEISGEPVFAEDGCFAGYRGVGRDVSRQRLAEQRVQQLARYDSLTGLANRNQFLAELQRTIARAERQGSRFALCFVDLDRFKAVNDSLGHGAGDELLCAIAQRLRQVVRQSDLVARLSGDEFVVLFEAAQAPEHLTELAAILLAAVAEPLTLEGGACQVSASIGIARYPDDAAEADELLKRADAAMYLAKKRGKDGVQFYTAELAEEAARVFALERELRLALRSRQLLLHYQPKVDARSGCILSLEALVRWQHPQRGMVSPAEFIPLAEERGLIVDIGRHVLEMACEQLRRWKDQGYAPPPVAINLSARQFTSTDLVQEITDALQRHRLPFSHLQVELTESALMADPQRAREVLSQLDALGIKIAIDDFGTGYSSLSYLKQYPASIVKIDRAFVHGLPNDRDDSAITQAVIAMAHSLGLTVVAEGVETRAQLEELQRLNCDEVQGFLTGRPMQATALEALLDRAEGCAEDRADACEAVSAGSAQVCRLPRAMPLQPAA